MRDKNIYTKEGLEAIIKHLRLMRDMMTDEEGRLLLLYSAAQDFNAPVDAMGRRFNDQPKRRMTISEDLPHYLKAALKSGETMVLPGYQD